MCMFAELQCGTYARQPCYWERDVEEFAKLPQEILEMQETKDARKAKQGSYRLKNGEGAVACTGSHKHRPQNRMLGVSWTGNLL